MDEEGIDWSADPEPADDDRVLRRRPGTGSASVRTHDYAKAVGYELGLRGLDICTGCGPGAMKGPMKGAAISHAKQRVNNGRYLVFSEPGIIAAESPNPIVNELVILPDIEKRLAVEQVAGFLLGVGDIEDDTIGGELSGVADLTA